MLLFLKILQRAVVPLILLGGGIASLVYGARHHVQTVYEEQEIEITLELPGLPLPGMDGMPTNGMPPDGMPPGMFDPLMGGQPPMDPLMPFVPPELKKIKQQVMVAKEEPECTLTRDVTIGGLVLEVKNKVSALRRTYSGAPPSLCPT